jgi:hypothetical protein
MVWMVEITWLPIRVETGSPEENGRLVLVNGKLVAVLVHVSDAHPEPDLRGRWFVEAGFGPIFEKYKVFRSFEDAWAWVRQTFDADATAPWRSKQEQDNLGTHWRH